VRKNIYDILNSKLDIKTNYNQLYEQFFTIQEILIYGNRYSINQIADETFNNFSKEFKKRCITLSSFNKIYGFDFPTYKNSNDINTLISFSEYIINICNQLNQIKDSTKFDNYILKKYLIDIVKNTIECMDECNYEMIEKDKIYIFVEKKAEAFAVAEIVDDELTYPILEYNHHSMKGDLIRKKETLIKMADNIEPDRKKLENLHHKYIDQLFNLLNKYIRHNSTTNEYISSLTDHDRETIYDDIYQMWLLAKLQLDNIARSKRMSNILLKTNANAVNIVNIK